jgi:ketopantoate reductase
MVIVALKAWQLRDLDLRPLLGPRTLVMPTQNGVDAPDTLAELLGAAHIVGGYTRITSLLTGPGAVRHTAIHPAVQGTGALPGSAPWVPAELARAAAVWAVRRAAHACAESAHALTLRCACASAFCSLRHR